MSAAASFGKTTLVLLGLWAILGALGLALGVIPLPGATPAADGADAGPDAVADAGPVPDATVLDDAGSEPDEPDAGAARVEPPPAAPVGTSVPRLHVCAEPALSPSLAAIDVVGDERPELVVGCATDWEILARAADGAWMRVARITPPAMPADRSALTSSASVVDVDGDGDLDTVLPLARVGAGGSTSGGGLFVLTRGATGALELPRSLAPIAATAALAIALPSGPGLAALDRANPFAREPSEAWVFGLGASPARIASPRTGVGATALAALDVDRDGKLDLLAASSDDSRLDVLFGDETAHFTRTRTLSAPSASEIAVGDLDGDGSPDAVVVGASVARLLSHAGGDPVLAPIEGAPTLRDVSVLDVDRDGHADVVGWAHPRLVVLAGSATGTYESRTLFELAGGESGPRRSVVVDLDADGAVEVAMLVVGEHEGARSLDLVVVPSSERGLVRTEPAQPLPDAPLSLSIALPDPNAP